MLTTIGVIQELSLRVRYAYDAQLFKRFVSAAPFPR